MPTYLEQGFIKKIEDDVFYKGSDGVVYKAINPRSCYIDFEGPKSFKNIHQCGRMFHEVDYQSVYKDKKTGIIFTILKP